MLHYPELFKLGFHNFFYFGAFFKDGFSSCYKNYVKASFNLGSKLPIRLPYDPLGTVTANGVSDFFAGGYSDTAKNPHGFS